MNDFLQSLRNGQAEKPRAPKTRKSYDNSFQYNSGNTRYHSYGGGGGGYQNQRNPNMKRPPMQQQQQPNMPMGNQQPQEDLTNMTLLADAIENLSSHVETLVKNQEYMASIQERISESLERQAMAIDRLVEQMTMGQPEAVSVPVFENHYVTTQAPESHYDAQVDAPAAPPAKETAPPKRRAVIRKRKKSAMAEQPSSPAAIAGNSKLLSRETIMDIIDGMRAEGATFDQVAKHLIDLGQPTFSGRGEWHAQTIHRLCSKK